jgi:hypothetical protein
MMGQKFFSSAAENRRNARMTGRLPANTRTRNTRHLVGEVPERQGREEVRQVHLKRTVTKNKTKVVLSLEFA